MCQYIYEPYECVSVYVCVYHIMYVSVYVCVSICMCKHMCQYMYVLPVLVTLQPSFQGKYSALFLSCKSRSYKLQPPTPTRIQSYLAQHLKLNHFFKITCICTPTKLLIHKSLCSKAPSHIFMST